MRYLYTCLYGDFADDQKVRVEVKGVRVATVEMCVELGCNVITPSAGFRWEQDVVAALTEAGYEWDESHNAWLPPGSSEHRAVLRAAWLADTPIRAMAGPDSQDRFSELTRYTEVMVEQQARLTASLTHLRCWR